MIWYIITKWIMVSPLHRILKCYGQQGESVGESMDVRVRWFRIHQLVILPPSTSFSSSSKWRYITLLCRVVKLKWDNICKGPDIFNKHYILSLLLSLLKRFWRPYCNMKNFLEENAKWRTGYKIIEVAGLPRWGSIRLLNSATGPLTGQINLTLTMSAVNGFHASAKAQVFLKVPWWISEVVQPDFM